MYHKIKKITLKHIEYIYNTFIISCSKFDKFTLRFRNVLVILKKKSIFVIFCLGQNLAGDFFCR
jgi:hypothetical protein